MAPPFFDGRGMEEPLAPRRVLLTADVRGWAFDQNMQDLMNAMWMFPGFTFDMWYMEDYQSGQSPPEFQQYAAVYELYPRWNLRGILPMRRTLGSLRASSFRHTESNEPRFGAEDIALVNAYAAFQVVTMAAYEALRPYCPGVMYLTNPVNVDRFRSDLEVDRGLLVASWSGNAKHAVGDFKGLTTIIRPAVQSADVAFQFAEYNTNRLAPKEMPAFYRRANVTLCASLSEGASNSVMEAMAAGHALIATDVGNHREMRENQVREFGESGILLVPRTVGAFAEALSVLKRDPARVKAMGEINRAEIRERWSWSRWSHRYAVFFERVIRAAP